MKKFTWKQNDGYECSSKGDKRFSAFYAKLEDGRSIEEHYQCDVKGYDPGGKNWKLGKGKPALNANTDLWAGYLSLWKRWAKLNPLPIEDLRELAAKTNYELTDQFATSPVNQANALCDILNNGF